MKYASQIQDPNYKRLNKDLQFIQDGEEIWTNEIKIADKKYKDMLIQSSSNKDDSLLKIRNILLSKMRSTKRYQDYIKESQSKIEKLNQDMKVYWTPEMIAIKKEIQELNKELYKSK